MSNTSFKPYLERHETFLTKLLNDLDVPAPKIKEAMIYSLFPGGKRLRPLLVYLSGEALGIALEKLDALAAAIELIHCYSLVHDDLPAMDNDDYRRGKASCHRAYDEATAILVGDSLQALAIEVLLHKHPETIDPSAKVAILGELVHAMGPSGMISGQSLDLSELCKPHLAETTLRQIHALKTGKLISACINMVLSLQKTTPEINHALQAYAQHLGIAFQIQDDYLDKYSKEALGKGRSSDDANQKITFAGLYSQSELHQEVNFTFDKALIALSPLGENGDKLRDLTAALNKLCLKSTQEMGD
jgi:farnesyl diphosphate synthase